MKVLNAGRLSVPLSPCEPVCCIWSRQQLQYYAAITGLISQPSRQVPAAHTEAVSGFGLPVGNIRLKFNCQGWVAFVRNEQR